MSDNRLDSSTRFEITALAFRRMTRAWPPGKDWPAALGSRDEDADRACWDEWNRKYGPAIRALLDAIDELRDEGCEI